MNTSHVEIADRLVAEERTVESALARCGWRHKHPSCWRLPTERGDAELEEIEFTDQWRQFQLRGGAVGKSTAERTFWDNARLFGPAKLVARSDSWPVCRLDLPIELKGSNGDWGDLDFHSAVQDPHESWARNVTAAATGRVGDVAAVDFSVEATADEIRQAGWFASVDEGELHVNLQTHGAYRQLAIERDPLSGIKLFTELIALDGLGESCVRAILVLAQEANARLPLVRFAIPDRPGRSTLRVEVSFGGAPGGAWLLAALGVLETAVAATVREMESLRDPELASLLLAATAAWNSQHHR